MSDLAKINYIVDNVLEEADAYEIKATSELTTDNATGGQELVFDFRKNGRCVFLAIDVNYIYSVKDIDFVVNSVIEKMEEVL